jgi:uncharacterized protein YjbI with pentapeptide repeats
MPTPELAYLMMVAPRLNPQTLGRILSNAAERDDGSEKDRIWHATSWTDILLPSAQLSTAVVKANLTYTKDKYQQSSWTDIFNSAISGTKFLASTAATLGRNIKQSTFNQAEHVLNTIINDNDFPRFLSENQGLVSCILQHFLEAPSETKAYTSSHPSRSIEQFVATLPELVRQLQKRQLLTDVTDINGVFTRVFETLVEDAASISTDPTTQNLYSTSLEVSTKFLDMVANHPEAAKNIIGRLVSSTDSPETQQAITDAVSTLKNMSSATKKGPDGKERKDFGKACVRYREKSDPKTRMLIDSPTEYYMHSRNFSNLALTPKIAPEGAHIEGFNFRHTLLEKGFLSAGSCLINCDFNFAFFEHDTNFHDVVIDANTFRTMIPSLRVAKAEGRDISLSGLRVIGNINFDVSHVDLRGVVCEQTQASPSNDSPPLSNMEIIIRRTADTFQQKVRASLAQLNAQLSVQPQDFMDQMFTNISPLDSVSQSVVLYALQHDPATLSNVVEKINAGQSFTQAIHEEIAAINANPELKRQFARTAQDISVDPFTNEVLKDLKQLSRTEQAVLRTILEENTDTLSKMYDAFLGTTTEKAALLFDTIKTSPQFKFRKQLNEYHPPKAFFTTQHIDSMRRLFVEIGCGPFIDTVEFDQAKHPPQIFGSLFQKTLCFLSPNTRHLFGKNTKFGQVLASRSFLQICKLIVYSIRHPQKMWRTIKDSAYVMDQIGWITWKDPRDIDKAKSELVSKLVTTGIVGDFINNPRLPDLAFATTTLFPNSKDAAQSIEVGKKFYSALNDTGVIKNFDQFIKGSKRKRSEIIAPFLSKVIKDDLLNHVNTETAAFLANIVNTALNASENNTVTAQEVLKLVGSGKKAAAILTKYGIVDKIEYLLLESDVKRLDILKKTIHDPKDLSEIITALSDIQQDMTPLVEKSALLWSTQKAVEEIGVALWYQPDQAKLDAAFKAKASNPNATIDLNSTFSACSFGNSTLIGTEAQPINWTNIKAVKFDIWGTTLKHVNLDGSTLSGYANPVTAKWYFKGASFDHAKLERCSLNNVTLKHAYMQDVELRSCDARNLNLAAANLMYGTVAHCNFSEANFKDSTLYGSYFTDCTINNGIFTNTQSEHAVFCSHFTGVTNFDNANLENANFDRSTFKGHVSMRNAVLINAKLDKMILDKTTTLDVASAILTDKQLDHLKTTFPGQLQNVEQALIITADTMKNLESLRHDTKTSSAVEALKADRAKTMLKGRFSGRKHS